jgi:hypothetical protein
VLREDHPSVDEDVENPALASNELCIDSQLP